MPRWSRCSNHLGCPERLLLAWFRTIQSFKGPSDCSLRLFDFISTYMLGVRETGQFLDEGTIVIPSTAVIVRSGNGIAKGHFIRRDSAIEE